MDIIEKRRLARKEMIEEIKELLKSKELDDKVVVLAVMQRYNCARRTAQEYVQLARFENGY